MVEIRTGDDYFLATKIDGKNREDREKVYLELKRWLRKH